MTFTSLPDEQRGLQRYERVATGVFFAAWLSTKPSSRRTANPCGQTRPAGGALRKAIVRARLVKPPLCAT